MLIGVISDTHDNLPLIERAVARCNEHKAGFVIHAGDYVAPFAIKPLEQLKCPWIGVFGNNDGEKPGLTKESRGRIQPAPFELNLDGKKVVVVHDLAAFDRKELVGKGAQLIVHGHSHEAVVEMHAGVLFVNPGEIGAWLTGRSTLVMVETQTMEATIEEITAG
jgi:putative phosphoesterase